MSSFFFYSSGAPRDLHSFPTRRSSDLALAGQPAIEQALDHRADQPGQQHRDDDKGGIIEPAVVQHGHAEERSEEHTSELQSHSDLVCRLLLEKKKKKRKHNKQKKLQAI